MLEKSIEASFQRYAKSQGWLTHKLDTGTKSGGWPDRMVVLPNGQLVFIEFKTPKGKLTELQTYRITQLRNFGQSVYVCRSRNEAVKVCEEHL